MSERQVERAALPPGIGHGGCAWRHPSAPASARVDCGLAIPVKRAPPRRFQGEGA